MENNRQLFDVEVERNFLKRFYSGGSNILFNDIDGLIDIDTFTLDSHKTLWKVISSIGKQYKPINCTSIYLALQQTTADSGILFDLMGKENEFVPYCGAGGLIDEAIYLASLKDRRDIMSALLLAMNRVQDFGVLNEEILEDLRNSCDRIMHVGDDIVSTTSNVMNDILIHCESMMNGTNEQGCVSGFKTIDKNGGLHPSDLNIVAGETSNGKTSFALAVGLNTALAGNGVAVYSLEMNLNQLAARLIAMQSHALPASTIQYKALTQDEFSIVYDTANGLMGLPMYFDRRALSDIDKMCRSIRQMKYNYNVKVIIIDYLQLITIGNGGRKADRITELAEISRRLKNVAKELDICVILLSQLKRDDDPIPTIKRLRGCGEIEEAADNIYLVYYAAKYGKSYPGGWKQYSTTNTALVFQAKGRNVGTHEFLSKFDPALTLYEDFAEGEVKPKASEDFMKRPDKKLERPDAGDPSPF